LALLAQQGIVVIKDRATNRQADVTTANALKVDIVTASAPVEVIQDTAADLNATVIGTKTSNAAAPGATNIGTLPAVATAALPTYTEGRQVAASTDLSGRLAVKIYDSVGANITASADPCQGASKTYFPVDIVTATTTEIANAVVGQFFYICSVNFVTAAANNVAIVEDDTDACGSPTAGLNGGTTAGEGWNFAANGGISLGDGNGSIMKTATANRYLCIMTSAGTQLSGTVVYVSAP
jgi:hypothetical protein